jgi:AcrR family transcriptional regulator
METNAKPRITQAERRERTREGLLGAAERLFTSNGFHPTSLDQIAAAAGYTKGAIYFNFESKEDLFFAVYERRAARTMAGIHATLAEHGPAKGIEKVTREAAERRREDDGWLAVFFEFWAHVLRHPELRERFVRTHAAVSAPLVAAVDQVAAERGLELPVDSRRFTTAVYAMQVGLQLERLTQPDVVDEELGVAMSRLLLRDLGGER